MWAQILNTVFTPIIIPTIGVISILYLSNFREFTNAQKLSLLWVFFSFSLLIPAALITMFRLYQGWSTSQVEQRERRTVPYTIAIVCYLFCYYLLCRHPFSFHFKSIIITALIILVACSFINQYTNISTHCAAMGGIIGLHLGYAFKLHFNPLGLLCILILLAGIIGSCQITLHKHTLSQTLIGYGTGIVAAVLTIFII